MTIRLSAYETLACSGSMPAMNRTIDVLKEGTLESSTNGQYAGIIEVQGFGVMDKQIPAFVHPIVVPYNDHSNVFVDSRPFGKVDPHENRFVVRNAIEYKAMLYRGALNKMWVIEKPAFIRDISPLPINIFVTWLSESISRRFMLEPQEQYKIAILAAIFYNSNFTNETVLDDREKQRLTSQLMRVLKFKGEDVLEILEHHSVIKGVADFCKIAEEVTGSIRLKQLNPGVLFSVINNTFFGPNASEIVAVAIEHPPTWLGILISVILNFNYYKNSVIARIMYKKHFDESRDNFELAIANFIKHYN